MSTLFEEGFLKPINNSFFLAAPRTCNDLKLLGVDISGDYFIDPDGPFYGALPVKVFCDVKTGKTNGLLQAPDIFYMFIGKTL